MKASYSMCQKGLTLMQANVCVVWKISVYRRPIRSYMCDLSYLLDIKP